MNSKQNLSLELKGLVKYLVAFEMSIYSHLEVSTKTSKGKPFSLESKRKCSITDVVDSTEGSNQDLKTDESISTMGSISELNLTTTVKSEQES